MTSGLADYKIILYRILGNDLPPRHRIGQTYDNLKFTLDYEANFPHCQKKWVVNRIVDPEAEERIIALLKEYKQPYIRIPFNLQEYQVCGRQGLRNYLSLAKPLLSLVKSRKKIYTRFNNLTDMRKYYTHFDFEKYNKILYVMNNNGARNLALRDGKRIADWVLPFDGNCCFTESGYKGVIDKLSAQKTTNKYFLVPMYRLTDNKQYLNFRPEKYIEHEPQIIFGKDTKSEFDQTFRYGHMSKVELLKRLRFKLKLTYYGFIIGDSQYRCGYVLRLFSGITCGEELWLDRCILRKKAIDLMLRSLDRKPMRG